MRTRSAKKLAQRIDLYYFKHASPLRRWRTILSIALPAAGLLWLGGLAIAGSRAAYSSGPVSTKHAFAEAKCEVCHVRDATFRAHVSDKACVTCHDAPAHARSTDPAPSCAACHREHQGRTALARTADDFCVRCHGDLHSDPGSGSRDPIAQSVRAFPAGHPEFRAARPAVQDPGTLRFNHQIHLKKDLRGPAGPEQLECAGCHLPQLTRTATPRRSRAGLMAPLNYEQQCARCHPLFFDERIDTAAPHEEPAVVRAFVRKALGDYVAANPKSLSMADSPSRRLPLNFSVVPEPPARTPAEWVERRSLRAEQRLWDPQRGLCAYCHKVLGLRSTDHLPAMETVHGTATWMPRAAFDHGPHLMVDCTSCHDAAKSTMTGDVIMPAKETCATCHAPGKGAESRCFECHAYHEWSKEKPVAPRFRATDFR